jgi:hypothetical protein
MITIDHEPSITGLKICREIFNGFMNNDYKAIIHRLDQTSKKWTKNELQLIHIKIGTIGNWKDMKKSASPLIAYENENFTYSHHFPGLTKWTKSIIILKFTKKTGSIYHVEMNIIP